MWQPLNEEAPTPAGAWVALAIPLGGSFVFECRRWDRNYWAESGHVATHWMPLPDPPVKDGIERYAISYTDAFGLMTGGIPQSNGGQPKPAPAE